MVGNAVVHKESEAKEVDYHTIVRDDYSQLQKVTSGRFLLSTKGLNSLYDVTPFTEVRYSCNKVYHGRRLHLKTVGDDVVQWLLKRRSKSPKPASCGGYQRLVNDTSFIGAQCGKWYGGKWSQQYLYDRPMAARDDGTVLVYYVS